MDCESMNSLWAVRSHDLTNKKHSVDVSHAVDVHSFASKMR
jgi:hypothetical protein